MLTTTQTKTATILNATTGPDSSPQPVTMEGLNEKIDRLLELVAEVSEKVDALDARVSEINLDYGSGYGIED